MMKYLYGIPVESNRNIPEFTYTTKFVFPRSKKSRIRKKYKDDHRNKVGERHFFMAMGTLFFHPNNLIFIENKIQEGMYP